MRDTLMHPLSASRWGHLTHLLRGYGCEPRYWHRALAIAAICALRQPAMWLESMRYGHRIAAQPLHPEPVFIVGHWRSGTTYLQNLLARDPQFGRVELRHTALPHEFLGFPRWLTRALARALPRRRFMDNMTVSIDAPWEEEMALVASTPLSFYHVSFFPRDVTRIFRAAVLFDDGDAALESEWRLEYVKFLRKVQLAQPGLPLLLKNPANTARVRALVELFPKARFIHIHRDPYEVYASTVHLYVKAQQAWGLHRPDRARISSHVLESYPRLMGAFLEQRDCVPGGRLVEVAFADLEQRPIDTVRRLYAAAGLGGFEAAAPRMAAHVRAQASYRRNALVISDAERAAVARRWGPVFERFGYRP